MWKQRNKSKYNNVKIKTGTSTFDSKKEFNRWNELCVLLKSGMITDLQKQVKFQIVPKINGVKRTRFYVADFVYTRPDGKKVIEDVKSPITKKNPVYTLKRDLILWQYPDYIFVET